MITSSPIRHATFVSGALLFVLSLIPGQAGIDAVGRDTPVAASRPARGFAAPIAFERNLGQHAEGVRYAARRGSYRFAFADEGVHMAFTGEPTRRMALRPAGNPHRTSPVGEAPLTGRVNYLQGRDRSAWHTDIPTFGRVRYPEVWRGVDVVFYGNDHQLEYDVEVAPGADAGAARFSLDGVESLAIAGEGQLVAMTGTRSFAFSRPVAYQNVDGVRRPVIATYVVEGREFRFDVGEYDRSRPLVIDPVLVYSTFLGGSQADWGESVAVDGAGNVYVTGTTLSLNFPTRAGAFQRTAFGGDEGQAMQSAFVTKLSRTGALVYSTYIGAPDGRVIGYAIGIDGRGNAYITGNTNAPGFPLRNAYQAEMQGGFDGGGDAFLLALSASGGSLVYSSFLGGSSTDTGLGLAVTPAGEAVVVGCTSSPDFPLVNAADATFNGDPREDPPGCTGFALKMGRRGDDVVYSTFLRGSFQAAQDVALDAAGRAFITGAVGGEDFATTSNAAQAHPGGGSDGFLVRLGTAGTWQYSTYLGGPDDEALFGIAVDSSGNMYVTGHARGDGFPTTPGAHQRSSGGDFDAVIAQIAASGGLVWSTYLGGEGFDEGSDIDLDLRGRVVVAGFTGSDLPATADAVQRERAGWEDAFVAAFRPGLPTFEYFTYLGGEAGEDANAVAIHLTGRITVVGRTTSTDYPLLHAVDGRNTCSREFCNDGFVTQQAEREPGLLPHGAIVVHAADATAIHGRWRRVADRSAAGGFRLELPDAGAARVPAAANPSDYFEVTTPVIGGMDGERYVLWIRGRAQGNHFNNDSAYVQFSNSMTGNGVADRAIWQIGTTEAQAITIEDCIGCGLSGWGWQDGSFGIDIGSVAIGRFAEDEVTIRVQAREDGISIDQLVLVPQSVNVAPGFQKDDNSLYPAGRTVSSNIVLYTGVDLRASQLHGAWQVVDDASAAGGRAVWHANAPAPKISTALASPMHYFELTFEAEANTNYAFWVRGRADGDHWSNDSVFVQLTNTAWPIGSTSALEINLEHCADTGLNGWTWRSDNWCAEAAAPKQVAFTTRGTQTIRVQTREDGIRIDQIVFGLAAEWYDGPPHDPIVTR